MPNQPLLSIVIPTRNRAETAVYAIRSALAVSQSDNIEVIVHDCSDRDELAARMPLFKDARLKYVKVPPCNMTANFNLAFKYVTGKYVTYIGDDDCVLDIIIRVAEQCDLHGVDTVKSKRPATYFWPKFDGKTAPGYLVVNSYTNIENQLVLGTITKGLILRKHYGFGSLPSVYQGMVKVSLMRRIEQIAGECFATSSPDHFLTLHLCFYANNSWEVEYPFIITGISHSSNTSDSFLGGNYRKHFETYKDVRPGFCRTELLFYEATHAEVLYNCFKNMNMEWLFFKNYPLITMYSQGLVARKQSITSRIDLITKYYRYVSGSIVKIPFFIFSCFIELTRNMRQKMLNRTTMSKANHHENMPDILQAAAFLNKDTDSIIVRLS
jgi:glycosyltransferase involved in cell wall biosynthesis